jgi:DNA primase
VETRSVEGKLAFDREVKPRLLKMRNPLERSLYEKEIGRVLGIDQGTLRRTMGGPAPAPPARPSQPPRRESPRPQEVLLSLMVKFSEVTAKVMEYGADRLLNGGELSFARAIAAQVAQGGEVDLPSVLEQVESPEERARLSSLLVEDAHLEDIDPLKAFEQCRQALERGALKGVKDLARELAHVDPDSPRYAELLGEIERLRTKKSKLL